MGITLKHTPEGLLLIDDSGRRHQYRCILAISVLESGGNGMLPTMKVTTGLSDVMDAAQEFDHLARTLRISSLVDTFRQWSGGYPVGTSILLDPEGRWANWRIVTRLERETFYGEMFRHDWTRTYVDADLPRKQNVIAAARQFKALCEYLDAPSHIAEIG